MGINSLYQSLSSSPYLAGRPFLAAFVMSLFGRIASEGTTNPNGWIARYTFGFANTLAGKFNLPVWMIGNLALIAFAALAIGEHVANRNSDIRDTVNGINTNFVKPVLGFLLTFGLVNGEMGNFIRQFTGQLGIDHGIMVASTVPVAQASSMTSIGTIAAVIWSLIVSFTTWMIARIRDGIVNALSDIDDGSLGLVRMFLFTETGMSIIGIVVLFILPVLSLILFGMTVFALYSIRRWFDRREETMKVACQNCAKPIYRTALFCPHCATANAEPHNIGVFGQSLETLTKNRDKHRLNLIGRKRCPSCATRLPKQTSIQTCSACKTVTFGSISEVNSYLRALDLKLPQTLIVCALLSFVPVLGLVPGIVYYRLSLIASLRGYIPITTGCMTRWGVRLITMLLVALQFIPIIGAAMLPLMCFFNYGMYRAALRTSAEERFAKEPTPTPALNSEVRTRR